MKLLTVNMTLDPRTGGGTASRTLQFSRALSDRGVECAIATTGSPLAGELGPSWRDVTVTTLGTIGGRFRVPYSGFAALRRAVRTADIVLLMNHWTILNVLAWRVARRAGKPYAVCPAGALPAQGRSRLLKQAYNALYGRRIVRHAAAHVAITDDERSQFAVYGVDPARVVVVPNGMPALPPGDGPAFRSRHRLGDSPLLLFVGRLAPIKGPDLLVEAFARTANALPGWQLVLGGPDDGMEPALRRQIAASGVGDRVHLVGYLDESGKADALAAADLVVVPSRREAMSIIVLEAAAAGCPVLVTDRCGVPEVAESGGGWAVEPSVPGLERGLVMAAADRGGLRHAGLAWQRAAAARFAWPVVAARLHDVLLSAVERARRS